MESKRRLPLAGTAASVLAVLIAAVGGAWALNQSSYMVFQFNPYLVGAGICAVVAVAARILPSWPISRG